MHPSTTNYPSSLQNKTSTTSEQLNQLNQSSTTSISTIHPHQPTIKMQSIIVLSLSLLASLASAAALPQTPSYQTVTVQAANDFTGANADVVVPVNAQPQLVGTLFAGTAVDVNGAIIASSAQLVANFQNVACYIATPAAHVELNDRRTFVSDGGHPIDVSAATITCFNVGS
jgi:hypothetical protein